MFNWLKKKAGSSRFLGIDMAEDGFAVAVVEVRGAGSPRLCGVRWCAFPSAADRLPVLKRALRELDARGLPVIATLPHPAYSLVQLEAPELSDEELREAMRWRVKDLIDFPVEEAVIDIFRLPASRRPGAPALLYVVVAKAKEVQRLGRFLEAAGLDVEAIDIVEMSIRNLSQYVDRPNRPHAYLYLQPGQTIIEIADGPQVYLSRRVLQDYESGADTALLNAQMENLALEVQRSLDYFESQYAQGAAARLLVIAHDENLYQAFSSVANLFLTVPAARFDLASIDQSDGVDPEVLGRGVTAIGAAMRGLSWAA